MLGANIFCDRDIPVNEAMAKDHGSTIKDDAQQEALRIGIEGRSRMSKQQLIEALRNN